MLTFERDFIGLLGQQRERAWDRAERYQRELRGRRIGIVGYGGIGREVARQSRSLGMSVWAMNRSSIGPVPHRFTPAGTGDPAGVLPDRTFRLGEWQEFLPELDYLCLTVALNQATRHLLGAPELGLLQPQAVLLNPARAHLVDEAALGRALRSGHLAGAALDSHYREPLGVDDAVWQLPQTVLTPHISGSTGSPQYWPRLWDLYRENLDRFRTGRTLVNVVPDQDVPD